MADRLDTPLEGGRFRRPRVDPEFFGRVSEAIARFIGTPRFLFYLTVFCAAWMLWNVLAPVRLRFDSPDMGFIALTLMLSLQASYAAPLILLAQNRQDDRDRVSNEQDRQRAERNLADTEYLAREMAAVRLSLGEVATRDFVRSELRGLLEDMVEEREERIRELERELAHMAREGVGSGDERHGDEAGDGGPRGGSRDGPHAGPRTPPTMET
ncbi:hypothetical protein GCM10023169_12880 [Georgenia halophila]|uniref:DUF1003 domain-containing protein n=1 Tax=Georgenia halophila TaxID=620889 RepID=A0ABP8KV26_9MICO